MKVKKFPMLLALMALILSTLACEFSASMANISDTWMSADEDGAERVTAFAQDSVFYAQVDLQNAPDDTTLKAVWIAVEVQDTEPNFMIDETELATGDGLVHFTLSNDNLWPTGKYKVDLYINGELASTLEFEVR